MSELPVATSAPHMHPTVGEAFARLWNEIPSLVKTLILGLGALLLVLLPANLIISAQIYATATQNIRSEHQKLLTQIADQIDQFISLHSADLDTLARAPDVLACAANGCQDAASVFAAQLRSNLDAGDVAYTELGFIDLNGQQTVGVRRGIGSAIDMLPGSDLLKRDPVPLRALVSGQVYVFPIGRDPRNDVADAYQSPLLRLLLPVYDGTTSRGHVMSALNLDGFFAQNFVYADNQEVMLLDTASCLLASSDDTRRADLYLTWRGDNGRVCYGDRALAVWDITTQQYQGRVFSTRVIYGALTSSNQRWTLLVEQPLPAAYAQADALRALLTGAHLASGLVMGLLIWGSDRATRRLLRADQQRLTTHARDTRFNPFNYTLPVDDPKALIGRTGSMATVIGAGVMAGSTVIVTGDRGIGKTSLLRHIERRLKNQQIPDPVYTFVPVWMDVAGIPCDRFYGELMGAILGTVEDHQQRTDLRFHRIPAQYGVADFREDINEVIALPTGVSGREQRLVVCLDNLHVWFSQDAEADGFTADFRAAFRDVFTDVGEQFRLIAAGTNLPAEALEPTDVVVTLGPLDPDDARKLVRQPLTDAYPVAEAAIEALVSAGDCLPAEIQRIAHHAVQAMLAQDADSITLQHVERATDRAIAEWEPIYRRLWYGGSGILTVSPLTPGEKQAILHAHAHTAPLALLRVTAARFNGAVYSDAQGELRLTTLFSRWLLRQPGTHKNGRGVTDVPAAHG